MTFYVDFKLKNVVLRHKCDEYDVKSKKKSNNIEIFPTYNRHQVAMNLPKRYQEALNDQLDKIIAYHRHLQLD